MQTSKELPTFLLVFFFDGGLGSGKCPSNLLNSGLGIIVICPELWCVKTGCFGSMGGYRCSCPFNFFDIHFSVVVLVFEGTLPQKTSKQA